MKKTNVWKVTVKCGQHNHEADSAPRPQFRKLRQPAMEVVRNMTDQGSTPSQILTTLRQSSGPDTPNLPTLTDLYNARRRLQNKQLSGRPPLAVLLHLMNQYQMRCTSFSDAAGVPNSLFFSHPAAHTLSQKFPTSFVLLTSNVNNRFRSPFLHLIGMTGFLKCFTAAFCFLPWKSKPEYEWEVKKFK